MGAKREVTSLPELERMILAPPGWKRRKRSLRCELGEI